ncbi:MAG: pentapeptide repeat-containing protein [Chloroflexota bacterium]
MRRRVNAIVFWIIVLSSMGLMILLIIRPDLAPSWSGVGQFSLPGPDVEPAKTLWDWMELLVVPVFLLAAAWWLGTVVRSTGRTHIEAEQSMDAARRQQRTLETYYADMTEMLLSGALRASAQDATVRHVAQVRTMTVLRSLDESHKGELLQFLSDSGLLEKKHGLQLERADLRGARLNRAVLSKTRLWMLDLRNADLTGANLNGADLWLANLAGACLRGAKLQGAHLGGAILSGADLRGADLGKANLRKANLNSADLRGAAVTLSQLSKAGSLEHLILPDGTLFEDGEGTNPPARG